MWPGSASEQLLYPLAQHRECLFELWNAQPARSDDENAAQLPAGGVNLEDIERSLVVKALTQARHNKTRAAKLLGLTRAQLYSRIEKYGLAGTES